VQGGLEYEIVHSIPGRVRLRIPALLISQDGGRQLQDWISRQPGVSSVRTNAQCASVVICYAPECENTPAKIENGLASFDRESLAASCKDSHEGVCNGEGSGSETPQGSGGLFEPNGWRELGCATAALALSLTPFSFLGPLAVGLSAYSALPSFRRAYDAVWYEGRLNVDVLDSLAICVSTLQGNLFTTAFMTWLISLGDYIRDQTAAQSRSAVNGLLDYQQKSAWVRRGREKVSVPVREIGVGDIVVVYDGEMIPVDGQVVSGRAIVDQRTITGESMPVAKGRADKVYAASVVHQGKLYLRANRAAADSLAAQIVQMVDAMPAGETRMQNYAEKFADRLVAPSLGLAGLMYLLTRDLNRMLSMLIVDFGTGIRVAAPTSVLASISAGVRQGVVIRGGNRMERLSEIDSMIFDKTGTLTRGAPSVVDVISYDERSFPSHKILEVAAAAELRFKHPVALATVAKAREAQISIPSRTDSRYHVGLGVEAQVNGYYVHFGSERFLRKKQINIRSCLSNSRQANRNGQSTLVLAVDGQMVGQLIYQDQIRSECPAVLSALRQRQIRNLIMLTGDNFAAAHHVASTLGIEKLHAEILPHEKAEVVQELRRQGRVVAMVGDGINDAAALSYADIGMAMKNGTDLAQESAHVVLLQDDLSRVVTAVDVARNAVRLIQQNYGIVVGMNLVALAMALAGGLVRPELTALVSNGSAVVASVNGLRPLLQ
jgi:heavy metal translocating P-type ATPase